MDYIMVTQGKVTQKIKLKDIYYISTVVDKPHMLKIVTKKDRKSVV